jgi:hypothetical protein
MSGDITISEKGNTVPQDSTRCLSLLKNKEGITVVEDSVRDQDAFEDDEEKELVIQSIDPIISGHVNVKLLRFQSYIDITSLTN